MSNIENKVRTSAQALHDAIVEARAAGYKVELPHQVDGLPSIAVSETGRAQRSSVEVAAKPADAAGRRHVSAEPKPLA